MVVHFTVLHCTTLHKLMLQHRAQLSWTELYCIVGYYLTLQCTDHHCSVLHCSVRAHFLTILSLCSTELHCTAGRVSKRCERTVAQNVSEIVQYLGFWMQKSKIYHCLTFFGWFYFFFYFFFMPILFAQNFQTRILIAQKNLLLESLTAGLSNMTGYMRPFCIRVKVRLPV